jgi:hypothetical protein
VESRSGRARGDAEQLGDLHERQPEVVVQDEDRALLDGQVPEGSFQLVAIANPQQAAESPGSSIGKVVTDVRHERVRWDSS